MNSNNSTYLSSLNKGLHSIMESDPRVVILGEDILDPYGGAFKVTSGLSSRFPDRVFTTPVSEAGLVGVSVGLAMRGLRPVAEIMFGDFLMLAADQLINHAAKFRWVYNDKVRVPLVVRTPVGGRRSYGPTHSQCLEKHFLGVPGLWVVAPSIMHEPGNILKKAVLDCDDPVLFIESKICYGKALAGALPGMVADTYSDADSPFPTIHMRHDKEPSPSHGLVFCYGEMAPICIEAVERLREKEGLSIDMAVLSQVSPTPITHIRAILDKCKPALCVYTEESVVTGGWSSEISATVEEIHSTQPNRPPIRHLRIGSKYTPVPASRELESRTLPQAEDMIRAILNCF